MSKRKIAQLREPDKLDRALLAGYRFTILLSPSRELVNVKVYEFGKLMTNIPGRWPALAVLDRAVDVALGLFDGDGGQ